MLFAAMTTTALIYRFSAKCLLLATLWPISNLCAEPPGTGQSFSVRDVRVFDGERVVEHANVIVRQGLIVAVGPIVVLPSDLTAIDGRGKTLLPGLIDAHVHLNPGAQRDALRFGVTTELDMFDSAPEFARWRAQRIALAPTDEADSWSAGLGVTVAGGHPTEMGGSKFPVLASAGDAAHFVDDRVAEGSDYIKLILENGSEYGPKVNFETLTPEEIVGVVDEASRLGKLTVAHIARQEDARLAVQLGVRGLAHMFMDQPIDTDLLHLMKERHVFVIATLTIQAGSSGQSQAQKLAADASVDGFLSARQKATLTIPWPSQHPERLKIAEANTKAVFQQGIPVLAGTDAPAPSEAHGVSLDEELALLVEAGLAPTDALAAATARPAAVFGLADRGRISAGLRADLVLVDGDPTKDIHQTTHIAAIWKNGYPVNRSINPSIP